MGIATRATILGGRRRRKYVNLNRRGLGASAGAGAGARLGGGSRRGRSLGKGGHRERVSKSLGCGARALRKYACDTSLKRQTVHMSVELQMKGVRDDSL
eukprot:6213222-Pleurochrysis_carterae.AAC.7